MLYRPRVATVAPIYRFTPDDVIAMAHSGIIDEDARVELVDGVLVKMSPFGVDHDDAKEWLNHFFARDAQQAVRVESMFLVPDGYLIPDLQGSPSFPRKTLSRFADLVVEIARRSHARDREKAADYARAGVPEYWIVDVVEDVVIVHREPSGEEHADVTEHRDGTIQPLLPAPPLALDALFARAL